MINPEAETTFKLSPDAGQEPALMLTREEVSELVLHETLRRQGVVDVPGYLAKQSLEYRVWLHPKMGASVVILGARAIPQPEAAR